MVFRSICKTCLLTDDIVISDDVAYVFISQKEARSYEVSVLSIEICIGVAVA